MGVMGAIMHLMATYYAFDLSYPRMHSMVLAVFQTVMMEEPYKRASSKGYKLLMKQLESKLKKHGAGDAFFIGSGGLVEIGH